MCGRHSLTRANLMIPWVSNAMIVLSWFGWSFLFWRALRKEAVAEDRIFDLTFYSTLVAFVFARLGFVISHSELFLGKSWLLIPAIWVSPGLSWLSGLVGGVGTLTFLSRQYKVRLGIILDALVLGMPVAIVVGLIGFLPTSIYEIVSIVVIGVLINRLSVRAENQKWPYGIVGVWFFFLYAALEFVLEFSKTGRVYWGSITANQWILIGIFAESVGVLYVRGGGRERFRPIAHKLYEFISKRHAHPDTTTS